MNMYTKLSMHLSRHQYKRGQYKGDAPADPSRRGKNHFRVTRSVEASTPNRWQSYGGDIPQDTDYHGARRWACSGESGWVPEQSDDKSRVLACGGKYILGVAQWLP